jgi:hypothetical protein
MRTAITSPDETTILPSQQSPLGQQGRSGRAISGHAELTRQVGTGAGGPRTALSEIVIPGRSTVTLSPFGNDVVFLRPTRIMTGQSVRVVLTFRHAGKVTIEATVTPPGTP